MRAVETTRPRRGRPGPQCRRRRRAAPPVKLTHDSGEELHLARETCGAGAGEVAGEWAKYDPKAAASWALSFSSTTAGPDILGNVIPFIPREEEKLEEETKKLLGDLQNGAVKDAGFSISAQCNRVAVEDGHTESVSVKPITATT